MARDWKPPSDWTRIRSIDLHVAGEPLRVIAHGIPAIPGDTMLAKRRWAQENIDHLRKALMWEPRGHADMYGCIPTEPVTQESSTGVLFMHNEGFSTMCGHGIIGFVTAALETGMVPAEGDEPVLEIDTPVGRVTAAARRQNGTVAEVSFRNVPSFVYAQDETVDVPGIGSVDFDVAFGGAFYGFCDAEKLGLSLTPDACRSLIDVGTSIKRAIARAFPIEHPLEEELGFLYGTIIVGPPENPEHHSRNVCIFAEGQVDRSPTGTGVSARAALHYAKGELRVDEPFVVESILATCFTGRVVEATELGPYAAVIPEVTGSAHIVGRSEWMLDRSDPLKEGFILR